MFFWSEEHAREFRQKVHRLRGAYMTAEQMRKITKIIQSAIFAFEENEPWGAQVKDDLL